LLRSFNPFKDLDVASINASQPSEFRKQSVAVYFFIREIRVKESFLHNYQKTIKLSV